MPVASPSMRSFFQSPLASCSTNTLSPATMWVTWLYTPQPRSNSLLVRPSFRAPWLQEVSLSCTSFQVASMPVVSSDAQSCTA